MASARSGDEQRCDVVLVSKHSALSQAKQPPAPPPPGATADTVRKKSNGKELTPLRTAPPPAVARRNARERNRVKQVNNGFANLRQHIPHSIAAAYESGRNGNKKLSKVETLRMAVDYIRSLENLLALGDESSGSIPNSLPSSYQTSLPSPIQPGTNYAASLASPSSDDDDLSCNSTPPPAPLQLVQINGTDAFHLVPMHVFDKQIKMENHLLANGFINPEFKVGDATTSTSLSPELYSDSSLSPGAESDIQAFIPVFNVEELSSPAPSAKAKEAKSPNEEMRILCRNLIMLQAEAEANSDKQPLNMSELISW